jgi:hypothetical protein
MLKKKSLLILRITGDTHTNYHIVREKGTDRQAVIISGLINTSRF